MIRQESNDIENFLYMWLGVIHVIDRDLILMTAMFESFSIFRLFYDSTSDFLGHIWVNGLQREFLMRFKDIFFEVTRVNFCGHYRVKWAWKWFFVQYSDIQAIIFPLLLMMPMLKWIWLSRSLSWFMVSFQLFIVTPKLSWSKSLFWTQNT